MAARVRSGVRRLCYRARRRLLTLIELQRRVMLLRYHRSRQMRHRACLYRQSVPDRRDRRGGWAEETASDPARAHREGAWGRQYRNR